MKNYVLVVSLVVSFCTISEFNPNAISAARQEFVCGQQRSINEAIKRLRPGDTIFVSGTCNENLLIPEEIQDVTIDGQGKATISGVDGPTETATITIRAKGITIKNFAGIPGPLDGIYVTRDSSATIDNNVIENAGRNGILVNLTSSVRIINNTIQGNAADGIVITESSSARIGFVSVQDPQAKPNIIQNNGDTGISILRSSSGRIVGNTIRGNVTSGVLVNRVSHSDVASNVIDSNGGDGIFVSRNSGVNLGEDTGTSIFDSPNSTALNNGGFGVRCAINSYGDGRIGTLKGNNGTASFATNCINATGP